MLGKSFGLKDFFTLLGDVTSNDGNF